MMTSHGQQNAIPHAPANEGGAHPSTPEVDRSLSVATNDEADQVSPNSVPSDDVPSPLAASTPPPTLRIDDTPPGAKQTCDRSETNKHPSCRKRLLQEPADTVKASLPDKDFQEQAATAQSLDDTHVDATINSALVGKTPVEKKRSRGASSMLRVPCAAPNLLAGWSHCLLLSREDFGLLLLMFYRACWKAPPGELQPFAEVVEPCVGV